MKKKTLSLALTLLALTSSIRTADRNPSLLYGAAALSVATLSSIGAYYWYAYRDALPTIRYIDKFLQECPQGPKDPKKALEFLNVIKALRQQISLADMMDGCRISFNPETKKYVVTILGQRDEEEDCSYGTPSNAQEVYHARAAGETRKRIRENLPRRIKRGRIGKTEQSVDLAIIPDESACITEQERKGFLDFLNGKSHRYVGAWLYKLEEPLRWVPILKKDEETGVYREYPETAAVAAIPTPLSKVEEKKLRDKNRWSAEHYAVSFILTRESLYHYLGVDRKEEFSLKNKILNTLGSKTWIDTEIETWIETDIKRYLPTPAVWDFFNSAAKKLSLVDLNLIDARIKELEQQITDKKAK